MTPANNNYKPMSTHQTAFLAYAGKTSGYALILLGVIVIPWLTDIHPVQALRWTLAIGFTGMTICFYSISSLRRLGRPRSVIQWIFILGFAACAGFLWYNLFANPLPPALLQ